MCLPKVVTVCTLMFDFCSQCPCSLGRRFGALRGGAKYKLDEERDISDEVAALLS